jgi:hypothetical protein
MARPLAERRSMEEPERKYWWVAFAEDNSVPRPEPDPERGFWPMYFNASPVIVPTDEGDDALCLFSTEGGVISYLRWAEQEGLIGGAKAFSISGREGFREVLARYPVHSLGEASKGENACRSRTVGDPSHLSDRNVVSLLGVVHA